MLHSRFRSRLSALLMLSGAFLYCSASSGIAQEAQKSSGHAISYGNVRLAGYRKITASLAGIHIVGTDTVFELRAKDHVLHRLHADDIRVSPTGSGYEGELNGNVHYTQLQTPGDNKLIDGTADRALYKQSDAKQPDAKQSGAKQDATVTLIQAHTSLFRDGKEIGTLDAGQVVASQTDETITGTGAVRITARTDGRHAEVTADKIIWNRRSNTLEASGKAHISYIGPDKKDAVADADHIKIDLKSLEVEIE